MCIRDRGEIRLSPIDCGDFWCLLDELCDDNSGFIHNRRTILQAYKDGNLYGLRVNETDKMYERGAIMDNIFCNDSFYLLPCFCVKEKNTAILIWTHTRARNMGLGKTLVELLQIEFAYKPLPESIGFWEKCNVKYLF